MSDAASSELNNSTMQTEAGERANDPLVGTAIGDHYEIVSALGSGATGTTYKAQDKLLDRTVAVKILHGHLATNPSAVERFKREYAASTTLSHANIARVYSQSTTGDGRIFMVMDYLEGITLAELIKKDGKLEVDTFFELFLQTIDALAYAHKLGIVHRDIKPSNILVCNDAGGGRRAVIVDFGLAKCIGDSLEQNSTQTGTLLGSSAYMSPEQCRGQSDIDGRSDIYSLACVMLEALIGRSPFEGQSSFDIMYKHVNESLSELGFLKTLPESLSRLLQKCLQKDRDLRYKSMDELKSDFDKCYDKRDTLKRRLQASNSRGPSRGLAAALFALLVIGLIAYGLITFKNQQPKPKFQITAAANSNDKKILLPPEKLPHIPYDADKLSELATKYNAQLGPQASLTLLERWEREHASEKDPQAEENRAKVIADKTVVYCQQNQLTEAERCAKQLLENHFGPAYAAVLLVSLPDLYIKMGQPQKGLDLIDRFVKSNPELFEKDLDRKKVILYQKGKCYLSLNNYKTAARLMQAADNITTDYSDTVQLGENSHRFALITALTLCNQAGSTTKVIRECEKYAALAAKNDKGMLGHTYFEIGLSFCRANDLTRGRIFFEKAKQAFDAAHLPDQSYSALGQLANLSREQSDWKAAVSFDEEQFTLCKVPTEKMEILSSLADDYLCLNNYNKALQSSSDGVDIAKQLLKTNPDIILTPTYYTFLLTVEHYRGLLGLRKRYDEAEKVQREWTEQLESHFGPNPLSICLYISEANNLHNRTLHDEAIATINKSLSILDRPETAKRFKEHNLMIADFYSLALNTKSSLLRNYGNFNDAVDAAKLSISYAEKSPSGVDNLLQALLLAGDGLNAMGQSKEAAKYFDRVEPIWVSLNRGWEVNRTGQIKQVADFKASRKDFVTAEKLYKRCIDGLKQRYHNSSFLREYYNGLADLDIMQQNIDGAMAELKKSETLSQSFHLLTDAPYAATEVKLWKCYYEKNDLSEAEKHIKNFINVCGDSDKAYGYYSLSLSYVKAHKPAERKQAIEEGLKVLDNMNAKFPASIADFERELGYIYKEEGNLAEAERHMGRAINTALTLSGVHEQLRSEKVALFSFELAQLQMEGKKYDEACSNFDRSIKYYEMLGKSGKAGLRTAIQESIKVCKSIHRDDKVAKLQLKLDKLNSTTTASQPHQ